MVTRDAILDEMRDAAALGRLLVVTGAGISSRLKRPDGEHLPDWGTLVHALGDQCDKSKLSVEKLELLEHLLPTSALADIHGDALIEASEILKVGFADGQFEKAVAALCTEEKGECSDTHNAIAEIAPVGIITFNYDTAHETAFDVRGSNLNTFSYDEDVKIKSLLKSPQRDQTFLLKAHGCVTRPSTLVLTSSSYQRVLAHCRAYRLLLQHALVNNTVLIVGFALRDRDFDQLMSTLEVELGTPVRPHAFIAKEPDNTPKGVSQRAAWAAVTARFDVNPIYVDNYADIPDLIRSMALQPGPFVKKLIDGAVRGDLQLRQWVHDGLERLGPIGRRQIQEEIKEKLRTSIPLQARSELIYILGKISNGDVDNAKALQDEIIRAASAWPSTCDHGEIECVAHALLAIRRSRIGQVGDRKLLTDALTSTTASDSFRAMDNWLGRNGGVPRIQAYATAACAEIETRGRA